MPQPEITFIVTYPCPGCQASLEAKSRATQGWLRCPRCGRASLPPDTVKPPPLDSDPSLDDDVLVIGPGAKEDGAPLRVAAASRYPGGARRVTMAVSLLITLTLLGFAFSDGNFVGVAIYGAIFTALLMGLVTISRRR